MNCVNPITTPDKLIGSVEEAFREYEREVIAVLRQKKSYQTFRLMELEQEVERRLLGLSRDGTVKPTMSI